MTAYYDTDKYKKAELLFDKFLDSSPIDRTDKGEFAPLKVSTITCVSKIAEEIDIKRACQFMEIKKNDIVYIESNVFLKGKKKHAKAKDTYHEDDLPKKKKKKRKNQLFSNQISIGFKCNNKCHSHNNPISVKLFRNGRIQMTGCKDMKEIETIYNRLYKKLLEIPTEFHLGEKIITIQTVKNLREFKEENIKTEMVNGTFYTNSEMDLEKVSEIFQKDYNHREVYVVKTKKSPLNLSITSLSYFDKVKKKDKTPSVFIYSTGSINMIASSLPLLMKTYKFISDNINDNFDHFNEVKYKFNYSFFRNYEDLKSKDYEELLLS